VIDIMPYTNRYTQHALVCSGCGVSVYIFLASVHFVIYSFSHGLGMLARPLRLASVRT
jgi:hypothetical protein